MQSVGGAFIKGMGVEERIPDKGIPLDNRQRAELLWHGLATVACSVQRGQFGHACQNRALRLVTGQLRSTPLEALRAEAEIPSMHTTIRRNRATAWEKTL